LRPPNNAGKAPASYHFKSLKSHFSFGGFSSVPHYTATSTCLNAGFCSMHLNFFGIFKVRQSNHLLFFYILITLSSFTFIFLAFFKKNLKFMLLNFYFLLTTTLYMCLFLIKLSLAKDFSYLWTKVRKNHLTFSILWI
jgi:hypothetical protein